tara:strand:+ start:116 stop:466 length:351 start_codon:yes stop_codon:yes gene_type:complete
MKHIKVIIPAYNEQDSIGLVVRAIPNIVNEIIVVNNNSTDNTAQVAKDSGATVLFEKRGGYGYACLKGIDYLRQKKISPDVVVFLDGDFSRFSRRNYSSYCSNSKRKYRFCCWSKS